MASSKLRSQNANGDERRARLIAVARELVRADGMAGLSLRTVAELDGTSTQAIYTLFGGKTGLIQALYADWVVHLEQRLLAADITTGPVQLMQQAAHIYREQALADPKLFLAGAADAEVFAMLRDSRAFALFAVFVKAGMDQGLLLPTPDPLQTAQSLWAAVHGAVLFELCGGVALADGMVAALLRGLSVTPD